MRWFGRSSVPAGVLQRAGLARGERTLAEAVSRDGSWLLGTRDALVVVPPTGADAPPAGVVRVPWERVETADWDREEEQLRVVEVGDYGRVRPVHTFTVTEPGQLLPMVRERVTASVLLQRRVVLSGRSGVTLVARRPPRRDGEVVWACDYDPGVDPLDPAVREVVERTVREAQDELGVAPPSI